MYCSACGVAIAQGLTYCNYCGAKLSGTTPERATKSSEANPQFLLSSMIALFVFGLVAITMLMGVMKVMLGLPSEQVLTAALLPFLVMLLLEGLCFKLLLQRNQTAKQTGAVPQLKDQTTKELAGAAERLLPEPIPSVTDHTTRTLEPVHNQRNSK
ncbi:MAG TPA: hypothetical protein VGO56_21520 [Pyrinomonadaceae bacterium]|jgi:hypothetical protein|nr:hypothetical protein [Pyrinomonadaceae bacterium]